MNPPVIYNKKLLQFIKNVPKHKKKSMAVIDERCGSGVRAKVYEGHLKDFDEEYTVCIKKMKRGTYCNNEFEALMFLREKMICGELPGYYNFLYGCYSRDDNRYFILEKADEILDDVMTVRDHDVEWYKEVYMQIVDAVDHLEKLEFNHGDLWNENIMLRWLTDEKFVVIFIDWDSAFMTGSNFQKPSQGGGYEKRDRFMLGYDLNRYFDAVWYAHKSYLRKKDRFIKRLIKNGESVEDNEEVELFDLENIIYPDSVISMFEKLDPMNVDDVVKTTDISRMSAKNVREFVKAL